LKGTLHFAKILIFFVLWFCLVSVSFFLPEAHCRDRKHVLVLQSYQKGLEWTDNENEGISSVMKPLSQDIELYTQYMDTKRFSDDKYYLNLFEFLKNKYASTVFDVIICSDENAFNFFIKNHDSLFAGVPMVFCGVNYFRDSQIEGYRNLITGVVEAFDIPSTLRTALRLHPKTSKVVVINDRTTTGLANKKILDEIIPEFKAKVDFIFFEDFDMSELLEKVRSLSSGTIILLMSFNKDRSGHIFDYDQSLSLISQAARVPIYGVWDFYLGKGIVGGMLTSGRDQGRVAAQMALRILNGEPVRNIPVVKKSPNRFMFDYRQMKRFGIVPADLPNGSTIINQPSPFYRLHPDLVWGACAGFAGLVLIIVLLLTYIRIRRRSEQALMESEERFRALYENNPAMYFTVDKDGLIRSVNPFGAEQLGFTAQELIGRPMSDLLPQDDQKIMKKNLEACVNNPGEVVRAELRKVHKNGNLLWVREAARAVISSENKRLVILIVCEDITERKMAEIEHIRLVTAIEQLTEAVLITDTNWIIQYVNPAFELMSGYDKNEIIGQHAGALKIDKHDKAFYREIRETLLGGQVWSGRMTSRRKDGTFYEIEVTASPVRDNSGVIINYVTIRRDITQEVTLQNQLRQAQKMEAIGTLAGGIAHDFNNILSAVIGYTEMAMYKLPEESPLQHNLQQVLDAGSRAAELVKQILTFSRQSEQEKRPMQIAVSVEEALKLLRSSLPTTIEIRHETIVPSERTTVLADPTEIHQVLMNLSTNAAHAMRAKGGVLTVNLSEMVADRFFVSQHPDLDMASYVCLSVSDTGHGMDAAVMDRIFDPYFTTKGPGEGTGMGLAIVQGIVKSYGGAITVSSKPEQGTTFNVFLPRIEDKIAAKVEEMEPVPAGTEHILFVDDEKNLAELGRDMLESLGYSVTTKTSSIEAMDAFRAAPDTFDLVITDMTMPGLTGAELAKELMAIRSNLPIILCTGFSDVITKEQTKAMGIKEFIMKPIAVREVGVVIRRTLDQSAGD
jgi:two-component system cell cycle sensor histidine kinase/response regulator CckA